MSKRSIKKAVRQATTRGVYVTFPVKSQRALNKVKLYLRNQGICGDFKSRYLGIGDPHVIVWQELVADTHTHDCWDCFGKRGKPFKIHPSTL